MVEQVVFAFSGRGVGWIYFTRKIGGFGVLGVIITRAIGGFTARAIPRTFISGGFFAIDAVYRRCYTVYTIRLGYLYLIARLAVCNQWEL